MKISSTIIFVPLTAALPVIPSAIYTTDQINAITANPNADDVVAGETGTIPESYNYKRNTVAAANVTKDAPDAATEVEAANKSKAERDVVSTGEEDGVVAKAAEKGVAAADGDASPNTQYPGATEIEAREVEKGRGGKVDVKLPMRKRVVKYLRKRVETNSFCPHVSF